MPVWGAIAEPAPQNLILVRSESSLPPRKNVREGTERGEVGWARNRGKLGVTEVVADYHFRSRLSILTRRVAYH